jgi:2-hydroxy-6-oxonona-2,4-dienedioate hydrolase
MKNVLLSGDKLHYVEEGEGKAIVLLYGLFGSVKTFDPLIRHLKKNFRVIVPILPIYDRGISINIFTL